MALLPDLHHMFVCLTQAEATNIVTMAAAEIHPEDFASGQQHETTAFMATDKLPPPTKGGKNDVTTEPADKDDAADKKRKAVEATDPTPDSTTNTTNPKRQAVEATAQTDTHRPQYQHEIR